jgi:nucleotide-binding universal stress UspA family protein
MVLITAASFTHAITLVLPPHRSGEISKQLLSYQQENSIDLLVMGAFSGSRLRQFFIGSNTIMMLESCNIPIMVVK